MSKSKIGIEISNEGFEIGKDPRTMSKEDLNALGHIAQPMRKIIRAKCLDCAVAKKAKSENAPLLAALYGRIG